MQMNSRSLVPIGLMALLLSGIAGCKKKGEPSPQPEPEASTSGVSPTTRPNSLRAPLGPIPKLDPQLMKNYRLDGCYYGTLTLRQARDSYLASLGKDEPSAKKIPNFGVPTTSASGATPTSPATKPGAAGAAPAPASPPPPAGAKAGAQPPGPKAAAPTALAPGKIPAAAAKPEASAANAAKPPSPTTPPAALPPPLDRRPFDFALRAPHERNARTCTAALGMKEPAMGDVDAALAVFAPFAVELAKDITTANSYYLREEYKKDNLAKGKELHKKLLEEFQKLDELQNKLGDALAAWRKDHPLDASKQEEGEKLAYAIFDDARDVLVAVLPKKTDAHATNIDKLEKSINALKEWSSSHATDTWAKIMVSPSEAFLKAAKEAKVSNNGVEAESSLGVINSFTSLIEARQRAISRAMIAKGQAQAQPSEAHPPGSPTGQAGPVPDKPQ
jgi:hypothetical protein